jgi:hypothetical protein
VSSKVTPTGSGELLDEKKWIIARSTSGDPVFDIDALLWTDLSGLRKLEFQKLKRQERPGSVEPRISRRPIADTGSRRRQAQTFTGTLCSACFAPR